MNAPRFYCPDLMPGNVTLSEPESRHALLTLRLRPGDALTLFDGRGHVAHGNLEQLGDTTGKLRRSARPRAVVAIEEVQTAAPPARTLTLIVAACKGQRLTWMIEKLTELGVMRIVLTDFERSVVHPGEMHTDKLRRTAIEACKQCGRAWLPKIESGTSLRRALASLTDGEVLIAEPAEHARPLGKWLLERNECHNLTAVVGPEGGLTSAELATLKQAGGHPVCLAGHILRVETAAVALAANWAASPS